MKRAFQGILMITPFFSPNIGGVETHLDDLCKYLTLKNYQVLVITYQPLTTKGKSSKLEKSQNLEVRRIDWLGYGLFNRLERYPLLEFFYLTPPLLLYSLFFILARRKNIDVIHAHGLNAALITKVCASVFRKRSVVSSHAVYNLDNRRLMARLVHIILASFDTILVLGRRSFSDLLAAGLPKSKMIVYHHWVDQNLFSPQDKKASKRVLGLSDKFTVLFVGRLIAAKGVMQLISAMEYLSDVDCLIVGDGPLSETIRRIASNRKNIIYFGKVDTKTLAKVYSAADITVVPSLYEEPFGRVISEALSCGTPVIASNRGGIPDILDQTVGILIEPTVSGIKEAIIRIKNDPGLLKLLTSNSRRYAEQNFSDKNSQTIESAYTVHGNVMG
ncbi:MAG: glycosyltransferase family 4 protein [Thaumarchaeota archaeon]|nr:glycosyltransferase family 4 protein [Nitrososphaerota archaeon]MCL5318562.1 glycosyltransferase family 4 protein [Nitrososphaerota archaeon]